MSHRSTPMGTWASGSGQARSVPMGRSGALARGACHRIAMMAPAAIHLPRHLQQVHSWKVSGRRFSLQLMLSVSMCRRWSRVARRLQEPAASQEQHNTDLGCPVPAGMANLAGVMHGTASTPPPFAGANAYMVSAGSAQASLASHAWPTDVGADWSQQSIGLSLLNDTGARWRFGHRPAAAGRHAGRHQ